MYGDHRDLHVLTHSFPTRRSSDLRPSADALMMRAGYAVTGRPIGLWLGEEGVGARAVRGHSPVVTRRGGLPWPSWTTIAHTPEATMRSIRRSASSYWS